MKFYIKDIRDYKNKKISNNFSKQALKYNNAKKNISLLAWALLEEILSEEYLVETDKLIIGIKDKGKPYFVNSSIEFSISHSNNLILIGIGKRELGVDIEYCKDRDNYEKLIRKIDDNITTFDKDTLYSLWTKKEARYKRKNDINLLEINIKDIEEVYTFSYFDKDNLEYKVSIDCDEIIEN